MLVVPHLILTHNQKIFLSRRGPKQALWANHWHCVTGGIEEGETPQQAIIRETMEEIGVILKEPLKLVTTIHLTEDHIMIPGSIFYALELFFLAELPEGQLPVNKEPDKQDAIGWFEIGNLPEPMVHGVKFGLECFWRRQNYGEFRNIYSVFHLHE